MPPTCSYKEGKCRLDAWSGSAEGLCVAHTPLSKLPKELWPDVWSLARDVAKQTPADYSGWNFPQDEDSFAGARFAGDALFTRASFHGRNRFLNTVFAGNTAFDGAMFFADAMFRHVDFGGRACFEGTAFRGDAEFGASIFKGEASFDRADFRKNAHFGGTIFDGPSSFRSAVFRGSVTFEGARFRARHRIR